MDARNEGVEIDKLSNAVGDPIGDACRDHAAIAVAEQDKFAQRLVLDGLDHITNMKIEIDMRAGEMRTVAQGPSMWA